MTDINELAQRMKAAALKAIADEGPTWFSKDQLSHPEGIALHEDDVEFIALASHENVLALVEALEAAAKQNALDVQIKARLCRESNSLHDRLREAEKRIAEFEFAQSLYDEGVSMLCGQFDELAAAMGWTSELAEKQGVSQLEYARGLKRRIAELEASHGNLREAVAGIHNTITGRGAHTPLAAILNASKRAYEESAAAAGKGD